MSLAQLLEARSRENRGEHNTTCGGPLDDLRDGARIALELALGAVAGDQESTARIRVLLTQVAP